MEATRRTPADQKKIDTAKALLMRRGYSEESAYRHLRTLSMQQRKRMADVAGWVLRRRRG